MKGTWVSKGDVKEMCWTTAAKMKKDENNKKERWKKKNNIRMFSQKVARRNRTKKTQTWFLKWKGREPPPQQKKNKSKSNIMKETVWGESNSHNISANRVPLFNVFLWFGVYVRAHSAPYFSKAEPPQKHSELRFRKKRVTVRKGYGWQKSN